jgi:hypothetical protein
MITPMRWRGGNQYELWRRPAVEDIGGGSGVEEKLKRKY